ncbi:LacI family DNA-binding transcriptional regulator [Aeromonas enteropelogenes]|uniref:LacI family DNA-binding transcriptional regulator n=1 Tax=Aeromonas enteropelogenes TaxID=29489 RepID=A0ABU9JC79_AEREN
MAKHSGDVKPKKTTLHDVAKVAGVSIATISRALNNKPGISAENRQKVLAVCRELGLHPPSKKAPTNIPLMSIALSLGPHEAKSSRYLGMLWPALATAIDHLKYRLVPISFEGENLPEVDVVVLLGITPCDPRISACRRHHQPHVCIGMSEGSFWVAPDDFHGSRAATSHLIGKGLTHIGFVTPTTCGGGYQFRYQGYLSVMANHELPIRELCTGTHPVVDIAAYRHFMQLPTAQLETYQGFVCACDETAIGVITALQDRGYEVPKQFAVVGYDGLPGLADELTTIEQDMTKLAERTAALIDLAIAGEPPVGALVSVTFKQGQTS